MIKKSLIFILFFYFLALAQTSFLAHFSIFNTIPNLILIFVIIYVFLEKPRDHTSVVAAFSGGFFLDVFSYQFIGFHILVLLVLTFFIKMILRRYVWTPTG